MCHSVLVQQCYSMQFWVDFTKFAEAVGIEKRNCLDFGVSQARFWILDPLQGFNQFPVSPIFTLLMFITYHICYGGGSVAEWLVCCVDSGAEGPGFTSQPRRCRITVLGKLFTPIVPLFAKQ